MTIDYLQHSALPSIKAGMEASICCPPLTFWVNRLWFQPTTTAHSPKHARHQGHAFLWAYVIACQAWAVHCSTSTYWPWFDPMTTRPLPLAWKLHGNKTNPAWACLWWAFLASHLCWLPCSPWAWHCNQQYFHKKLSYKQYRQILTDSQNEVLWLLFPVIVHTQCIYTYRYMIIHAHTCNIGKMSGRNFQCMYWMYM
jgi:hypothetical protein